MKITIILGAFLPVPPIMGGAVEKVWLILAQEFARRGHDVTIVSRKLPQLRAEEIVDKVRHLRVPGFNTPKSLVWLKILDLVYSRRALAISPGGADVMVTNTFWTPILTRNAQRGALYVHVARFPKWQMQFYQRAARLQAPSHAVAHAIAAAAPKLVSKIAVIPYPAPQRRLLREPPAMVDRENIILFVGRVHPEKGVHLLVDAFSNLARTVFADWKLMIVGPAERKFGGGGESYLASLQGYDNTDGRVIFAGGVFDPFSLEEHFRAARLFVYPSLAEQGESFGLAPLEAMTHGCAVLVSNLDCFHDFIRDEETGFIFDHRSEAKQNLQEKLEKVIAQPTLMARVAASGYDKTSEYSVDRIADQFLNDFDSLARKPNGGTS